MQGLEKAGAANATLSRRNLLAAAPAGLLAACDSGLPVTASRTPRLDQEGLNAAIGEIARRAAPARLGVGLLNLDGGEAFTWAGDQRFPMQSVFKLPLAAAVLAEVDAARLPLAERFVLEEEQLSGQHSPIALAWPARRDYTAQELLQALVVDSDNTAADVLMKRIGGPGAVTAWLVLRRVTEVRVDRYERELQAEHYGMPSFRPEWRTAAAFGQARDRVAPAARLAAMRAYMADPRDTATPRGMLDFLQKLDRRELVSAAATDRLIRLMAATPRAHTRLKAGLPRDAFFAHRHGTSGVDQGVSTAHNDVGIFTLADKRSYAIAAFLSGSTRDEGARDAILADVARAAVKGVG
jgi:beta-lactamase class A